MKFGALLGWGIVIYAVMTLAWSGIVIYGVMNSIGAFPSRILVLCVLVIVTSIAGLSLRLHSWKDILPYSVLWALIIGLLDAVYTVPFSGWVIYGDWNLWVGYTLVAVVPLLTPLIRPLPPTHNE